MLAPQGIDINAIATLSPLDEGVGCSTFPRGLTGWTRTRPMSHRRRSGIHGIKVLADTFVQSTVLVASADIGLRDCEGSAFIAQAATFRSPGK
jgi:hypothetical protein